MGADRPVLAAAQVAPSTWPENAPLAVLEAAVDGVPLLIADRGGIPEFLSLGARGAVVRSSALSDWRQALSEVSEQRQTDHRAGLEAIRAQLGWRPHLNELISIYENLRDRSK